MLHTCARSIFCAVFHELLTYVAGIGVTYSFKNTRTMIAGLDSVQESREMNEGDMKEGGSGFYGILRASELVPYDSAIFISTDQIPQDISLMKNAATILLKKRIRVSPLSFSQFVADTYIFIPSQRSFI